MTEPESERVFVTIHVLHHGRSLCSIDEAEAPDRWRPPSQWPVWHTWVSLRDLAASARACADRDHVIHTPIRFRMCETCESNAATAVQP